MAKTRRKKASGDVKILGGLDAITSLLVKAKKTGKKTLRDSQIRTGFAVSVGGAESRLCSASGRLIPEGHSPPIATLGTQS
jgi:hypothetical protein